MTTTSQTSKGRRSGGTGVCPCPLSVLCLSSSCLTQSADVSHLLVSAVLGWLSPGDMESTFSEEMSLWTLVIDSNYQTPTFSVLVSGGTLFFGAPLQADIAEALLTCVFQGSVIWNSQMSPWQMNGEAGVMGGHSCVM